MRRRPAHLTLPLLSILCPLALARSYNVTIDDQFGDPTNGQTINYTPQASWNNGQSCTLCTAKPPSTQAYMGTWKDATFFPANDSNPLHGQLVSASVPFVGTAVYVNCILTGSTDNPVGNTDMTFKIDGVVAGYFQQAPDGDPDYEFGVTVFSKTGLNNVAHTITLESGNAGGKALVMLDSITYTKQVNDQTSMPNGLSSLAYSPTSSVTSTVGALATASTSTPSPLSAKSSATSVIAGSVVGGAVAIAAIIAIAFLCHRRQRRRGSGVRVVLEPTDASSPVSPYSPHSVQPFQPNYRVSEMHYTPYALSPPSGPTLAPGDSASQVSSSRTSEWTSNASHGHGRQTFREGARKFAMFRPYAVTSPMMKVQNATDADMSELDMNGELKPPAYIPSKFGTIIEKGKS